MPLVKKIGKHQLIIFIKRILNLYIKSFWDFLSEELY